MSNKVNGKNIKKNFIWQLIIEVTNMLLPLVTSPILSRRLGVEAIGVYSYVYSISYCFIIVALLGIFQYGTREIAIVRNDRNKLNEKFTELFIAQSTIGVVVLILYIIFSIFISKYPMMFLIQGISLIGSSLILINWLFSGLEEFKTIAIKTLVIRIIGVICIVLFVKNSSDLIKYFLIMSLEPLIGAIIYIRIARKRVSLVRVKIKNIKRHFKGMFLLFIPVLTTYLYSSMDKVMLGHMSTMSDLGYYENATKALIARNLATALSTVLIPRMANLVGQKDEIGFNKLLNKSMNIVLLLTIAFGFGTGAISSIFSVVFWGKSFIKCSNLIFIMSLTLPAYGLTYVINNQLLVPKKREKVYIISTLIGVAVNFILNILLIPYFSSCGAALATLITQYFVLFIELFCVKNEINIVGLFTNNFAYILFGIVMVLCLKNIDSMISYNIVGLFIEIVIGIIIFSIQCLIFWLVTKNTDYLFLIKNCLNKLCKGGKIK